MSRIYILYDERACGNRGTEEAAVLVACDFVAEAQKYRGTFGNMACYSYKRPKEKEKLLLDQRWEWDWYEK